MSVSIHVKPGQRDAVVEILMRDTDSARAMGCDLYMVGVAEDGSDVVYVTEVWASREAHQASLSDPAVQAAIAEAMPLLTGEFHSTEFGVVGGLGV
ncbi:MAG TPA: antibiotic biosynthesis monooxygenase [Longimicrobium sp.]|nr:antibiotic biosynthesis monooxygenase [Longimicrobium sp.]